MRKTQYDAEHWLASAREARATAEMLVETSKTRKIMLGLAANYDRLAKAAAERTSLLKRQRPVVLTNADKLLLQAEEYRAIAQGMTHKAARASIERMADDCERAAARSGDAASKARTPEACILMAKECDAFAAGLPPESKKFVRRVAEQWRNLALRGSTAAG